MVRNIDVLEEYILCAAIHYDDGVARIHQPFNIKTGLVFCGRRHHNIINTNAMAFGKQILGTETQGFVTSKDRFLNRKEAGELAFKNGQIQKKTKTLYSEDLY